jgi:hypothetical protein
MEGEREHRRVERAAAVAAHEHRIARGRVQAIDAVVVLTLSHANLVLRTRLRRAQPIRAVEAMRFWPCWETFEQRRFPGDVRLEERKAVLPSEKRLRVCLGPWHRAW